MTDRTLNVSATENAGPALREPTRSILNRRSSRVTIIMPVEIVGQGVNGEVFREKTHTTVVNAHGALLALASTTETVATILLINKMTKSEVQCRVVYRKESKAGGSEVGLEFTSPQPKFWGITFPPDDWKHADRKMPVMQPR